MPVRSLNSSVLKWPDAQTVDQAVQEWAAEVIEERADVLRIGYIGSYARGDWGVRSDLDIVLLVEEHEQPRWRRGVEWDLSSLTPMALLTPLAPQLSKTAACATSTVRSRRETQPLRAMRSVLWAR